MKPEGIIKHVWSALRKPGETKARLGITLQDGRDFEVLLPPGAPLPKEGQNTQDIVAATFRPFTASYTVEDVMKDRFREGTTPRSPAYRLGFETKLRMLLENPIQKPMPWETGTAEADAFFSGMEHAGEYVAARKNGPLYE